MDKKLIALIAAAVLAVLGVGAVALYAKGANDRAFDAASLEPVLVVTAPVPAGAQAQKLAGSVELRELPKVSIAEGAVTDLADLGDTVANGPLSPGEQITTARFSAEGDAGLPDELPEGMQEIEIAVASPRVPSTVEAGSTVGVMVSYDASGDSGSGTRLVLSKVQVLDVANGTITADGTTGGGEGKVLRLAVSTNQAEKVVHASEFGRIWITNQNDATDTTSRGVMDANGVMK